MTAVNIHLSNSDVAMLKAPVLLATEYELVHTLVYAYTVKPRFFRRHASNGYQSLVNIRWHER